VPREMFVDVVEPTGFKSDREVVYVPGLDLSLHVVLIGAIVYHPADGADVLPTPPNDDGVCGGAAATPTTSPPPPRRRRGTAARAGSNPAAAAG